MSPARAQAAQTAPADGSKPMPTMPPGNRGSRPVRSPAPTPAQKSLTSKAIDKVKQVAKSASDIFSRVPCLPPKGGAKSMGSLPHVANKLAAGQPVVIVAFGSSSTAGLRHARAGIHLSQPAGRATAPPISDRRHHRAQSRQGRRGCAGNDEAAADRRDRHEAGSGDLAGRHQRGAAQSRSRRDRQDGGGRRRPHSGRRRRCGAGRSAIFAGGQRQGRKRQQDGASCSARSPSCAMSASSRASR